MGGSGGGSQTQTQEFKPPGYTQPYWNTYLQNSSNLATQVPYQQSGIPTVAPINDYQNTAMQLMYSKALYGTPQSNAANGAFMNAAQGNYANPYAQNVQGLASGQGFNPWAAGVYGMTNQTNPYTGNAMDIYNASANPYASDPYTQQMIGNTANMMVQGFANGTAAQNDAQAAMAGAYGGSGADQKQRMDAQALANQIGNMATQTQQQEQQYQGNMYNQSLQNALASTSLGNQMYQGNNAQLLQALGLGSSMYNQDVQNQLGANAQAGGMWNQDINNILSGGALGLQGANQYNTDLEGLMNAGNNWNTYFQKMLDSYNNQWSTENQYDLMMNEMLGNALSRASGSYYNSSTTQPGQSTLSGLLGLALTGAGIYSLFR